MGLSFGAAPLYQASRAGCGGVLGFLRLFNTWCK